MLIRETKRIPAGIFCICQENSFDLRIANASIALLCQVPCNQHISGCVGTRQHPYFIVEVELDESSKTRI